MLRSESGSSATDLISHLLTTDSSSCRILHSSKRQSALGPSNLGKLYETTIAEPLFLQ